MKYSNTAITQLKRWYKQVLTKCAILNAIALAGAALIAAPAMATDLTVNPGTFKAGSEDVTGAGSVSVTGLAIADTTGLQDALDGKQGTLSAAQLAAANSGITAEMVTQIGADHTTLTGLTTDVGNLNTAIAGKADAATTLAGYGITNAYTKTEVDGALDAKQDEITTTNKLDASLVDGLADVATSGNFEDLTVADGAIAQSKVNGLTDALDAKQDEITTTNKLASSLVEFTQDEADVLGSGITGDKVNAYDDAVTLIGTTSIASIGDGTITGAISTLNTNVGDVADDLGDVTAFTGSTTGNISNSVPGSGANATNASSAIANIDATIGQIHGLAATIEADDGKNNLEQGSTVSGHLVALAGAIGNRDAVGTGGYITAGATVAQSLAALDTALGEVEDVVDNHTTSLNSIAQLVDGGSVAADGTYTAGDALTAYDGADNLTAVVNKLETNKQETLDLTATSGLQWLDSPTNTQLAIKLADESGLKITSDGLAVKTGSTTEVVEGYLKVKYGAQFTEDGNGLKLNTDAVNTNELHDNAVTTAKINDGAVTEDKIAAGAVTHAKIGDGAVDTNNLADSAVETDKIADGAVTFAKIDPSAVDTDGSAVAAGTDDILATGATIKLGAKNADYDGVTVNGANPVPTTLGDAISTTTAALNNVLIADGSLVDDAKVYASWNGADSTLDVVLGDGAYANEYNIAAGDSITATFDALDSAIGDRSDIGSLNGAINTATATDVASGLKAAGDAIGDLQYAAPAAVAYGALAADTDLTTVAAQLAYNIGDAVTNTTNGVAADASVNANIDALNTKVGDVSTLGVYGYDATAADATLVAGVTALNDNMATVLGAMYVDDDTSVYDADVLVGNGFEEASTDLSNALTKYAENVATAMGTTFADDGSFENEYDAVTDVDYAGVTNDDDLVTAIGQLNTNIGDALAAVADRDDAFKLAADNTVNDNLAKLDAAIGDEVAATYGNIEQATAVNANLDLLDEAIGDRTAIGSLNDNINDGTAISVADGLKAAGDAIGDMNFADAQYISGDGDLSSAVRTLDTNLARVDGQLKDLKKEFKNGMASMAAMSALVPNPRATGNTSLSVGTGMYDGYMGVAVGGFHHITDNIMVNAGAAWGNANDLTYRLGVTWSW